VARFINDDDDLSMAEKFKIKGKGIVGDISITEL
jgi:hypothetical protein